MKKSKSMLVNIMVVASFIMRSRLRLSLIFIDHQPVMGSIYERNRNLQN